MSDERYMALALAEAQKGFDKEEVPIGAVIVMNQQVISKAYNQVELLNDSTAHAEILALTSAYNFLGSKYLPEATLYVTIEPCLMCSGALYWSKISRVVFGAYDEKNGYRKSTGINSPFHPKTIVTAGIMESACSQLVTDFFRMRR